MTNQDGGGEPNNAGQEIDKLPEVGDEATPETVEKLKTDFNTALAQKSRWREKAVNPETGKPWKEDAVDPETGKTYRALYQEAKGKKGKQDPDPAEDQNALQEDVKSLKLSDEKRAFQSKHQLSLEETDEVYAYATGKGIKPEDALNQPTVKAMIKAIREDNAANSATPGPSGRIPQVDGKRFKDMTPEERKKNFPKVVSGLPRQQR